MKNSIFAEKIGANLRKFIDNHRRHVIVFELWVETLCGLAGRN